MSNNQHLVEVLCAIRFDPTQNEWDSTFFGRYHELIKKRGYTEKKEQKQVQIQFELNVSQGQPIVKEDSGQIRMIFSNPTLKSAIILGENFISFHKVSPYHTWDSLINEIAEPGLEEYRLLGLGKGIVEVQCLYLNKYKLEKDENVTKYFKFLPVIDDSKEAQVSFQGRYDIGSESFIQLKLNTGDGREAGKEIFFECSSFVNTTAHSGDFRSLAQDAHDYANKAYRNVIK